MSPNYAAAPEPFGGSRSTNRYDAQVASWHEDDPPCEASRPDSTRCQVTTSPPCLVLNRILSPAGWPLFNSLTASFTALSLLSPSK